ncbi:amino acid aminotransferase [Azohydromonas australica]|uniref:amino acid aminotransferase n=1 Tax=Azohydromonas australica TaxID=364039 RepID=UPI000418BF82|nr:amino acid aminotransferase [Azohydromonas australica]
MLQHVPAFAGDPILSLNEAFQQDARPNKINLSIGVYADESLRLPAMAAVLEAEARLTARRDARPYLPMEGDAAFREAVRALVFGAAHPAVTQGRVATVQTIGSSGALKLGAEFIRQWLPGSEVWVSDPTWDNHRAIFESAGLAVHAYPYHDPARGVAFDAMLDTLRSLPARSVVLLHGCCHNPTGEDLDAAQWGALTALCAQRGLIPFVDLAYQGFGEGVDADAGPVRALAEAGITGFVANSLSKNMGLYGERCGALSVVCGDAGQAEHVLGQLKLAVRRSYSSPPLHAGRVAAQVLGAPELRAAWAQELDGMRQRILSMRRALHAALVQRRPAQDWSYLLRQRGMFSYTGLSAAQVDRLREEHAIYLVRSGRICLAGLNATCIGTVAQAIAGL